MKRMVFATALAAFTVPVCASVLFFDDFSDGDASGWFALPTGASYSVENSWYRFQNQSYSDSTVAVSINGDNGWTMSQPDYSVRVRCYSYSGNMGIFLRFNWIYQKGYLCLASPGDDNAAIMRIDDASGATILAETPMSLSSGQEYWLRFEVYQDTFGLKIWQGNEGDEPSGWLLVVNDGTYSGAASFGLYGHDDPGSPSDTNVKFTDVQVSDENSVGLDAGTWGALKASF